MTSNIAAQFVCNYYAASNFTAEGAKNIRRF